MKKAACYLFFILSIVMVSCRESSDSSKKNEGVIHFEIKYVKNTTNVPNYFLPKVMVMKFNRRYAKTTIDNFGFSLSYIYDLRKNKNITMIHILEHKFYYEGKKNEYPCGFDALADMIVSPLPDTISMEGLLCNKARVFLPTARDSFDVFYTNAFDLKEPNRTIPYKNIHGLLMQFNVILEKIEMQFKAKNVKYQEVTMSEFEVPKGFILISHEKMNAYIKELLDK